MTEREFIAADAQLYSVLGFVEEELEKLDCPMRVSMQISVAVEELFVNVAHYAYGGAPGPMTLSVQPETEGGVTLCFTDGGIPFDPLAKADPDVTLSAEERKIGGLGIYMVKQTMDDVRYRYENSRNILTIRKKF